VSEDETGAHADTEKTKASPWSHVLLIAISLVMLAPFVWMVLVSLKPLSEVENLNPWPSKFHTENYSEVFKQIPFAHYYFNSFFIAAWVTFLQTLTSAMAAFAFARLKWPGRDIVFKLYLATLMIPGVITMIPNYAIMVHLHLLDSYTGLIVPSCFSAFGTFLLRQFMLTIPASLDEAANLDGASAWTTFWDVIMPLSRAGLVTLAMLTFMGNYGSFLWPLILIRSAYLRTLPVGMLYFNSSTGAETNLIMAAAVMNIVPMIVLFVAAQKYLVKGIQLGAVKG